MNYWTFIKTLQNIPGIIKMLSKALDVIIITVVFIVIQLTSVFLELLINLITRYLNLSFISPSFKKTAAGIKAKKLVTVFAPNIYQDCYSF